MVGGEVDRPACRRRPRRPTRCRERRHDDGDVVAVGEQGARRDQAGDGSAAVVLLDVGAPGRGRQRVGVEHGRLQPDGRAGHLDLVRRSDEQHHPWTQRLALGQGDGVTPRQVGRGELGVHRLLDLHVERTRRRVRVEDGARRQAGDIAGSEQVVAERARRRVRGVVEVTRRQGERGRQPARGQRPRRHGCRARRPPPPEELQLHQTVTSTSRSAACWTEPPVARAVRWADTAPTSAATTVPGPVSTR